jgi:DNA (cytosine-5)-methyltransferase 1
MNRIVNVIDLFCGGGGWGQGMQQAANKRDVILNGMGYNHWDLAIETYKTNLGAESGRVADLYELSPDAIEQYGLDILIASPECTHHSNAAGGKPKNDQSRSQAYIAYRWTKRHRPKYVLFENVVEWRNWGPIYKRGPNKNKPIKHKKGVTYRKFVRDMCALGYNVVEQEVIAANYGDPTTRKRLFVVFSRKDMRPFEVPAITHTEDNWVPARTIIDWNLKGKSIFRRKKPLADKTLDRIWHGLNKYCKPELRPFLTMMYGNSNSVSIDKPCPTITAGGDTGGVNHYLADPAIINISHSSSRPPGMVRNVNRPLFTQLTTEELALAEYIVETAYPGHARTPENVDQPLRTVTGQQTKALIEAFLLGQQSGAVARGVDQPCPTISTAGAISFVEAFLIKFYGTAKTASLNQPLPTITCQDRFGLVYTYQFDILFRMLAPHELAAAMSFPSDYHFAGSKRNQVKMIGNAVAVLTAEAFAGQALDFMEESCRILLRAV